MKHLIVGLGNIGPEYEGTRHNIGFRILDALASASASNIVFQDRRYGFVAHMRIKNQELVLLKPSTYMNLSGNAVRYWMEQEKIALERLLVVCDDLSLPVGTIRMRQSGADGGHNGLKHIAQVLGTQQFNRLKFGIGNNFPRGGQVDFVLGRFSSEDETIINERKLQAAEAIKAYALSGMAFAMNHYNGK
ncbi:MAG: aminoacyl-tRNA hydrolase [Bacteroidaceae bacterium]|nr:aminoacyl-tRNA hydrolase [Bacteroidaceae bacterium]